MFHIYIDDNSFHIVVESLLYDSAYSQWKCLNFYRPSCDHAYNQWKPFNGPTLINHHYTLHMVHVFKCVFGALMFKLEKLNNNPWVIEQVERT